jgi:hypothetical protein
MGFWASDMQINTCHKVPLSGHFFKMTTFCIVFYESYLSTLHSVFEQFLPVQVSGCKLGGWGAKFLPPLATFRKKPRGKKVSWRKSNPSEGGWAVSNGVCKQARVVGAAEAVSAASYLLF